MKTKPAVEDLLNHLSYLGYEIKDEQDGTFMAKHDRLIDLVIEDKCAGILFYSWFQGNELAGIDRANFLECLNGINSKAVILRFYADKNNAMVMDAFYPKPYDRVGFAAFMDELNRDIQRLFYADSGVAKYCG
ncbi:MAG: hypothetical protein PHU23_05355 [Dehalococcoidales bacterium]|nr:hypothetical protein [Dehalococcoidales bacterium]